MCALAAALPDLYLDFNDSAKRFPSHKFQFNLTGRAEVASDASFAYCGIGKIQVNADSDSNLV